MSFLMWDYNVGFMCFYLVVVWRPTRRAPGVDAGLAGEGR